MTESFSFMQGWYAVLPAKLLKKKKPLAVIRFNLPLVFWRSKEGGVHCFLDRCPHRGAKLSIGKIHNNCIECPYHGFRFNTEGACELALEFNKPLPGLTVKKYAVKESAGMIWFLYSPEERAFDFPDIERLHQEFSSAYCETSKTWNSHLTYCIENQLDYTHLPSVHKNTIGRGFKYPENPVFIMNEDKITISFHGKDPVLAFYFPNIWVLNIGKKMRVLVYFAPINESETQLHLRTYSSILALWPLRVILSPLFNQLNKMILKQDQKVVSSQGVLPSYLATDDVLMKNDEAVKHFRRMWLLLNEVSGSL